MLLSLQIQVLLPCPPPQRFPGALLCVVRLGPRVLRSLRGVGELGQKQQKHQGPRGHKAKTMHPHGQSRPWVPEGPLPYLPHCVISGCPVLSLCSVLGPMMS